MNRKEWRILPILLVLVLIISAFGCSKKSDENNTYTITNENGEIEQYTFSGIPGDRPYNPSRDDMVYDRDKTTKEADSTQSSTVAPSALTENNTEPVATTLPQDTTEEVSTEAPTTEPPEESTTKKLTWEEFQNMVKKFVTDFDGTEEEAIAEIEKTLGRKLSSSERQFVYITFKLLGKDKPPVSEPPLG